MRFYHITKKKNINSIMKLGILPKYKQGLSTYREHTKVFLTNDIEKIIKTQGGNEWETSIAIIEVEVEKHEPHTYTCYDPPKYSDFEFIVDKVSVEEIKSICYR